MGNPGQMGRQVRFVLHVIHHPLVLSGGPKGRVSVLFDVRLLMEAAVEPAMLVGVIDGKIVVEAMFDG